MGIGAKFFGTTKQKQKHCLIIDKNQYRYQIFISDIAGQDIRSHNSNPQTLITHVRDWLNNSFKDGTIIPGGQKIYKRFKQFEQALPALCEQISVEVEELTYNNYNDVIEIWLKQVASV